MWVVSGLILFSVLLAALVYTYQDKVIRLFVTEANKHLKTKVQVGKISLSLLHKFPQISVALEQVQINEGIAGSSAPLATVGKIFCTFSFWDMLYKKYQVQELYLENGEAQIKVLPNSKVNYLVFGQDTTAASSQQLSFNLKKIGLKNMLVTYADATLKQTYKVKAHDLKAALAVEPEQIRILAKGGALVHTINLNKSEYFKEKETYLTTSLLINPKTKHINIAPSVIRVGPADYQVQGTITYRKNTSVNLKLRGQNTNIQSLLALLPPKLSQPYGQYQSSGEVYFNGVVKGSFAGQAAPWVNINFGCREASFYHPGYKQQIKHLSLTGNFTNGPAHSARTSVLAFNNFKGLLENRPFSGNLVYRNFFNPTLKLGLKADLDVAHVLGLFPQKEIKKGSGQVKIAINFLGNIKAFRAGIGGASVAASGDIMLKNVTLVLPDYAQPFRNLTGTFLIRKNDMAVTNFRGWLGNSDFLLNGYFKNAIGWLFLKKQHLLIEADFESRFLNFDQLLSSSLGGGASGPNSSGAGKRSTAAYKLIISPYLDFNVNAHVRRLQFRRFKGHDFRGNIKLKNQVIASPNMSFNVIGGRFGVQGAVDTRTQNNIKVTTTAHLSSIRVDSLFYVFENFGQNFLVQRHLKGELTATINSDLYYDSHLNAKTNKLEAEIKATIRNGQLNSFEPLQKLSAFADRRELANLRFAELSNNFFIQSRTVYIPEMEIRSNVSRASIIGFQGTHTFDQQMDYKFRIPLITRRKRDKDEAYGRVAEATANNTNLFLTLKGIESNYKIAYDKERVKTKIAHDLQREKQELTDILKGKKPQTKKKAVEPEEGAYFDF